MKNLKEIQGKKIQKVKQVKDAYSFELYENKKKIYLIIVPDKALFLTKKNYEGESKEDFCNILRKHLTGQIIQNIEQHEFDRVVEIQTQDYILIIEIFGKGNLILVSRLDNKIIYATEMRSWATRKIRPKYEYDYPPSSINPFKLNVEDIRFYFGQKEIVKILAKDFGFGGEFAEKICEKIGIEKNSKNKEDADKIYEFIKKINKEFPELDNINENLEKEFEKHLKEIELFKSDVKKKIEVIKKSQEKKMEEFVKMENTYRIYAESIYDSYAIFDNKLTRLRELQNQNISQEEIEERLQVKFSENKTEVLIKNIPINYKKSLEENANSYYNLAKKMKSKIEGIEKSGKEIEKKKVKEEKKEREKQVEKKPKQWHDQFRWFNSSDGFLVVSGKDAKTNERLIRKYMKKDDLVFHTDITGSPFTLVKNPDKKEIPKSTIQEAAEFCSAYSKAWKIGISLVDVYYITTDQVKKEGGLPQGSFMIYGEREWIRQIPIRIAVGNKGEEIIYGSTSMVKKICDSWIEISPGESSAKELFEKIKTKIIINLDELQKIVPYGKGEIIIRD